MNDFNDKNDTFIFKPEKQQGKPQVNRTESDDYSYARRGVYKREEEKMSPLVYVAAGLAAVLIITIIIGLVIWNSGGDENETNKKPEDTNIIVNGGEDTEDEDDDEEEEFTITFYGLIFNDERIYLLENEDGEAGYAIYADLYDNEDNKIETRRVRITEETEIRDNGQRISLDAFMNVIRNQGGDKNLFGSEIREEDNVVIHIAYDSRSFEEDIPEVTDPPEPEPEEPEPITPETPEPPITPEEPVEGEVDNTETPDGFVNGI